MIPYIYIVTVGYCIVLYGVNKKPFCDHMAERKNGDNALEYEHECEALNLIFHEEECVSLDIDFSDGCHNFSVINSIECQQFALHKM